MKWNCKYIPLDCNASHDAKVPKYTSSMFFVRFRFSRFHLPNPPSDVRCRLLHGIQLVVPRHGLVVIAVRLDQARKPLRLALAHVSRLLHHRSSCLGDQGLDHVRLRPVLLDTAPFFVLVLLFPVVHILIGLGVGIQVIQRVAQRLVTVLARPRDGAGVVQPRDDADDLAVGVALYLGLAQDSLLRVRDGQRLLRLAFPRSGAGAARDLGAAGGRF